MYRIVNKETELIYSSSLGWVEENGKMYGHCFEREEAEEILDKLISDGIPVAMEKDKVASRFESAANFSIKNLFIGTVITFIPLFITLFILRDIPLNSTGLFEQLNSFQNSSIHNAWLIIYSTVIVFISIILIAVSIVRYKKFR